MSPHEYFTQSELRSRGWTASMQKHLLGEPDKRVRNPIYRRGKPMKLYCSSRVDQAERSLEFQRLKSRADRRRAAIQPSIEARQRQTVAAAKACRVELKKVSLEHCQREAVNSYNEMTGGLGFLDLDDVKAQHPKFLDRITVNHLRHNRTHYDHLLAEQANKVGVDLAREIVRAKVYKEIMEAFPELEAECLRQLEDRDCDISLAA